jgi:DNA sulfur modification protein DndD
MKLERITLENFRQYFGRERLDFAKDKQRRVTVIHGVNGAGKTSLFLAINWCLYGSEYIDNVGELISKEAISRVEVSEQVDMKVEITFSHDGERYIVQRARRGIKMIDGSVRVEAPDEFTLVRMRGDGQSERVSNPIGTINAILPSNVRTYFLFDGEKIDDFAKPESAKLVREAIYLVFKLEILERSCRHLESVAAEYRRELKNSSSKELQALAGKLDKVDRELKESEREKTEVLKELEIVSFNIADIDQRLRETQTARSLQRQRDRANRDLNMRQGESDELTSQIRDLVTGAYFTRVGHAVEKTLEILEKKRERGEIPSNIRQQFIQDLLSQMRCICGRPFTEGSAEHQRLLSLIKTTLPDTTGDEILELNATLRNFATHANQLQANCKRLMTQRAALVDTIKGLEAEIDDIGRQLKESGQQGVSDLESKRQEFVADQTSYNVELGRLTERIEKLNKEIEQLGGEIDKAKKNEKREKLLSTKFVLAQKAAAAIKESYKEYADDMRLKIEEKTREIFKLLVWKDTHFQDVHLDENFHLEVIDRYGRPARPDLSAGERQVLSLSFITAMSRVSEEEAPLVMDTPFGRLSSQPRNNITKHLPELADQLVLLVTDEELHGQSRANLEPFIGKEYRLEFDKKTSCTDITEVRNVR